ncbi:hypothetical protein Nepgr_008720 [Nepenthes gracilis]|uniref:G-patch domain-containing protein n=1 Tax=Nepenthes gracilis TaxID=150966 RepID=A0AAD3S9K3_NEPGR|nr:hypothetical protein Nepgr_008720 [Nepenthes gracilis]
MKLSFSITSKSSSSKPKPNSDKPFQGFATEEDSLATTTAHHCVTEFDASKTPVQPKKLIVPPKENEWRLSKKMKNLDTPLRSSSVGHELRFEVESESTGGGGGGGGAAADMSYGLNLRQSAKGDAGDPDRSGGDSIRSVLSKKRKDDLDRSPGDWGLEQFDEVPVDGFGAAILAGYGWHEGRGIGRNAKEDAKVIEYNQRAKGEGIGIFSNPSSVGNNANGHTDNKKGDTNGKSESLGFTVGNNFRIIGGRDVGLEGRVVEVLPDENSLLLKLSHSKEEVMVKIGDVAELGSAEDEKCLKKLKELKTRASKDDVGRIDKKGKDASGDQRDKGVKEAKRSREDRKKVSIEHKSSRREEEKGSRVPWLKSHIRVRIISREFKGGRLYLKKGEVVDVVQPTTCDISMDDGKELVQGVDQDLLETALPRRGGHVLVLTGKHEGVYGSLVERDTEREIGVVQDENTRELLNVRLEQIAEYVGDPSYVGY